ncbi:MAG: glycosyltransferase [Candidatus Omnitrophica bacterium]|nr:glycosyltransferase [Candidatus Omnitrophota bacterium]
MPKVTVVTATYNRADLLRRAIESVLAQTFTDWEHVIVDDGSPDETWQVIEEYQRKDPRIRGFRKGNGGVASAMNVGLENAKGEFVCILDDDDRWLPGKLVRQVEMMEKNPALGFVYGRMSIERNGKEVEVFPYKHRAHTMAEIFTGNYIPTLTVMMRRSCLEKIGKFNTKLRICADLDMWLRLAEKYPFDGLWEVLAIYRYPEPKQNLSADKVRRLEEHLTIFSKIKTGKQTGVSRFLKFKRIAQDLFDLALTYEERRQYLDAAAQYWSAIRMFPFVGILLWWPEYDGKRFTAPSRLARPYIGMFRCVWKLAFNYMGNS